MIADALSSGPGPAGTASSVTAPVQGGRARKGLWGAARVGDPPCGGHRSGSRGKKQELHTHEDTPTKRCRQVHPPRSPWRDLTKGDNTTSRQLYSRGLPNASVAQVDNTTAAFETVGSPVQAAATVLPADEPAYDDVQVPLRWLSARGGAPPQDPTLRSGLKTRSPTARTRRPSSSLAMRESSLLRATASGDGLDRRTEIGNPTGAPFLTSSFATFITSWLNRLDTASGTMSGGSVDGECSAW